MFAHLLHSIHKTNAETREQHANKGQGLLFGKPHLHRPPPSRGNKISPVNPEKHGFGLLPGRRLPKDGVIPGANEPVLKSQI